MPPAATSIIRFDNVNPATPLLASISGECTATAVPSTTTDNCAGTITGTTSDALTYSTQGTHIITWNFDDGNGNSINVQQSVVILDVTAPVANVATLAAVNEECSTTPIAPTASDNCDAGVITATTTTSFPVTASTTLIWTYTDAAGNTSTQNQAVVIADISAPVANVTTLAIVNEECSATATAPTATDNCDVGTITGTTTTSFPVTASTTVTWSYTDATGNVSTQTQEIVIADVTAPLADATTLATVNDGCSVSAITAPTATDNCDAGVITGTTTTSFPVSASTTVIWSYTDATGNISTQNQAIVIADVTAPLADAATLATINEECSVSSTSAPTATDNCSGTVVTGTTTTSFPISSTTTVVWSYTDASGNVSTQNQAIVIADVTAPIADIATLATVNEECSATATAPTATDNCDAGAITGTTTTSFPVTTSTTVTWSYTDATGNVSIQTQEIVIADVTAPIANIATLAIVNEECSATATAPTATDNCDAGVITGTTSTSFPVTVSTTVTWSYTDATGNVSTQYQEIVINDLTAPLADAATLATITEECSVSSITAPTATDNCNGTVIAGTTSTSFPVSSTSTVVWSYTDASGNVSTQNQEIVINDVTDPIVVCPNDFTYSIFDGEMFTAANGELDLLSSADNCGISSITSSYNNSLNTLDGSEFFIGTTIVNWTVSDHQGNETTCSFNVVINADAEDLSTPLGVNEQSDKDALTIYPNPNKGLFIIDYQSTINGLLDVNIIDVTGRTVYTNTFNKKINNFKQQVDLNNYKTGVYYVLIKSENVNLQKRIIVTNK